MDMSEIKRDTPRLVVTYRKEHGNQDRFEWGIAGEVPILTLVGYVGRVQSDLINQLDEERKDCPESALVVAVDEAGEFDWYVHRDIPVDPLVGMLEVIKAVLIGSTMSGQRRGPSSPVLGPDGNPMRKIT